MLYHLKERAIEHTVLPWCRERGTAVVAYTPFGESRALFEDPKSRQGRVLREIAAAHAVTARQVALAFLLRDPAGSSFRKRRVTSTRGANAGRGMCG